MRLTRSGVLVVLAMFIATPVAWSYTYRPLNLVAVTAASALLALLCLGWRRLGGGTAGWATLVLAGVLTAVAVWRWRPSPNVTTTGWFEPSVWLSCVAVVAVAGALLLRRVAGQGAAMALLFALLMGGIGTVLAVPGGLRPQIDVWVLLQDAAHGVLEGANPYAMTFPGVPAGQTSTCFTYLPGSFLLVIPGRVLGDVRVALAAAFVVPWLVMAARSLRRLWQRPVAESVLAIAPVVVALVLPATLRVMQQSWTDSLLVGLLVLAVLCWRSAWVVLPIGLALATKQHALLLLPLLPLWLGLAEIARRRRCCRRGRGSVPPRRPGQIRHLHGELLPRPADDRHVHLVVDRPARGDAQPGPCGRVPARCLRIAWWSLPRGQATFPLAAALVLCAFNLTNKQSYVNQWWLVAELLLLSAVCIGVDRGTRRCRRSRIGVALPAGRADSLRCPTASAPRAPLGSEPTTPCECLGGVSWVRLPARWLWPGAPVGNALAPARPAGSDVPGHRRHPAVAPAAGPDRDLLAKADGRLTDLLSQFPARPATALRGDLGRLREAIGRQRKAFAGLAERPLPTRLRTRLALRVPSTGRQPGSRPHLSPPSPPT